MRADIFQRLPVPRRQTGLVTFFYSRHVDCDQCRKIELRRVNFAPVFLAKIGHRRLQISFPSAHALLREPAGSALRVVRCSTLSLVIVLTPIIGTYPTEPSISSWMSRFSSTAYSSGSSLVNGSKKPFTIMVVASACDKPRLIK